MSINTGTAQQAGLKAAAAATFVVFGINGLVFASWAARIPAVTQTLQITSGQMGTLLLCTAVGSLLALPTAGWVVGRLGTANTVRLGGLLASAAGVGIALSLSVASIPGTAVSLFFFGIAIGLWDVSQNIEGADVEHKLRRTIMPQFHAAFSGGAFLGALIGAGLSNLGVDLPLHLLVIVGIVLLVTMAAPRYFLPHVAVPASAEGVKAAKGPSAWRDSRTVLIGVVVLGATLTEGAGNDWIAKASVDGLGTTESTGALMFALFVPGNDGDALPGWPRHRQVRPGCRPPGQYGRGRRRALPLRARRECLAGRRRCRTLGRRGCPRISDGHVRCR
jgi:MFS family permease